MPEEAGEQSTEERGGAEQFPDRFQREKAQESREESR